MIQYHPDCKAEGNHRFALEQEGENVLIVIGLNPSTADEKVADPTMRRVLSIADANGYDGFVMLNLSSERATEPKAMSPVLDDKMHGRNLMAVMDCEMKYPDADVLLAFGNNITCREYLPICFNDIWETLEGNHRWLRIGGPDGITKDGHPRHPLYAKADSKLEPFDADAYAEKLMNLKWRVNRKKVDYMTIVEGIYASLADKVGEEVSVSELVLQVYGAPKTEYLGPFTGWVRHFDAFTLIEDDYWKIYDSFTKLVDKRKEYELDSSRYAGMTVGLPYNIPFIVKLRKK